VRRIESDCLTPTLNLNASAQNDGKQGQASITSVVAIPPAYFMASSLLEAIPTEQSLKFYYF
jgi:hypothetical protein